MKKFVRKYKREIITFVILMITALLIIKTFQSVSPVYARYGLRILIGAVADALVFLLLKRTFYRREQSKKRVLLSLIYFVPEIILITILFVITVIIPLHEWEPSFRGMLTGFCLILFYCKNIIVFVILMGFIHVRIGKYYSFFRKGKKILFKYFCAGVAFAAIVFLVYLISIPIGQYKYVVKKVEVPIQNFPEIFDGYTIVHLSDLHFGSLYSRKRLDQIIDEINRLNPDMICITGDFVIHNAEEALPFISGLKRLHSRDGIFAVLGNHDYMAYSYFKGKRQGDHQPLVNLLTNELGWQFLNNETQVIKRENDSLILAGVENISLNPYFGSRGDIDKTLTGIKRDEQVILMMHDPSVWAKDIVSKYGFVYLTLSGHTHGLQYFLPSDKAVSLIDKVTKSRRKGMYSIGNQYLYINSGIGTTMFRGRIGSWMEITQIKLTSIYPEDV